MSGLLLPGRAKLTEMTREINRQLRLLCQEHVYMTFVDAEDMTFDGVNYRTELFVSDQIHLNHDGQLLWGEKYIKPTLQKLLGES
jgi:lysophospholipase L1-like esterase